MDILPDSVNPINLAGQFGNYLVHPEIYAQHHETLEETAARINYHPMVMDPPLDYSKYGQGELFTEELTALVFWICEFAGITKPGMHYRNEPGTVELQGQPQTVIQTINNFYLITNYANSINWFVWPLYHVHFWLLLVCTLSYWGIEVIGGEPRHNSYPYCYDNIMADILLENGKPAEYSIYSLVDLFTWEGFFYLWVVYTTYNGIEALIERLSYALIFIAFYFNIQDVPFCVPGEIMIFGADMCDIEAFRGGITQESWDAAKLADGNSSDPDSDLDVEILDTSNTE